MKMMLEKFKLVKTKVKCLLYERDVIVSLGDFMYLREEKMRYYHIIIGCRILDIENWQRTHNPIFHYTDVISKTLNINHDTDSDDKRFRNLLESFEKKGFDPNSRLRIANNQTINDGTHRAALSWCYNVTQIPGFQTIAPPLWDYDIPNELETNLYCQEELRVIKNRIINAQKELVERGIVLTCIAKGINNFQQEQLTKELETICTVVKKERITEGYFWGLLPKKFDYYRKKNRLAFKLVSKYATYLQQKYGKIDITDNFVDGKIVYDNFFKIEQ